MNGMVIGRRWNAYFSTPPVFWEPLEHNKHNAKVRALFPSTVKSNSQFHAMNSVMSSMWANSKFQPRYNPKYSCEEMVLLRASE